MVSTSFANEQYRNQEGKAIGKPDCYQKVINCAQDCAALSLPIAAQILRCQKAFLLTTAAQNIHVFLRKSPLLKEHFFEWLKTANFSTACGTSTLKSPLLLGSDAPHVHPRLRKHPPRCTLDCGFKTSERPALRGFVAGPWALATAVFYLVIFSNGDISPQNTFKTGINAP